MSFEWQAESWLRWARTPGHDSYWYFRDAFFDAIVPALGRHRVDEPFERDGLQMHFTGWRYPLEDYARALENAGLLIERIREPPAPPTAVATRAGYERWTRLPNFLHLRAVKLAAPIGRPRPRLPLFASDDPTLAERDEQGLAGFGE